MGTFTENTERLKATQVMMLPEMKMFEQSLLQYFTFFFFYGASPPFLGLTCDTDRPAAKPVDEASHNGPGHEIDPAQEAAHPGHGPGVRVEISRAEVSRGQPGDKTESYSQRGVRRTPKQ